MNETEPAFYLSKNHAWAHPCAGCCTMISEGEDEIEVEKQYPEDLGGWLCFPEGLAPELLGSVFRTERRDITGISTLNTQQRVESRHEHFG